MHKTKVSKVFQCINVMFEVLQPLVIWPDKGAIIAHMPSCFKPHNAKAVCIIAEVEETPLCLEGAGLAW